MKVRIPEQPSRKDMLKQVQQLQDDMETKREELDAREFEFSSGGGMVKIKMLGTKEITSLIIDPSVVDPEPDGIEMLQDLITAAVNEAIASVEKTVDDEMGKLTGGLNLPNLPNLPF